MYIRIKTFVLRHSPLGEGDGHVLGPPREHPEDGEGAGGGHQDPGGGRCRHAGAARRRRAERRHHHRSVLFSLCQSIL